MKYENYITKKRLKGMTIQGPVNIPYGTICECIGQTIFYNSKPLCYIKSEQGLNYFWGYDKDNPKKEIERQKLALELYSIAPFLNKMNNEKMTNEPTIDNFWDKYGGIYYLGQIGYWKWNDEIFDLSYDELKFLINKIKEGDK